MNVSTFRLDDVIVNLDTTEMNALLNVLMACGVKDATGHVTVKMMQYVTGQQELACVTVRLAGWAMNVTNVRIFQLKSSRAHF